MIKRIHVVYHLRAPIQAQATIERVHRIHAAHCPIYKSLYRAIDITTEYRLQAEPLSEGTITG